MKNVIITGASRGIGRQLVEVFLQEGHTVYALSRNTSLLNTLKKENPNLHLLNIDITSPDQPDQDEHLLELLYDDAKQIDVLINNAGVLINKPFLESNLDDFRQQMEVNLYAPTKLIQLLFKQLKTAKGHVVNISSMGGVQGSSKFPGLSMYSASKGALNIMTECLAEELSDSGIAFNALALGAVQTEMLEKAFPDYKAPLKPDQMAEFIKDFALNAQGFINGKVIPVALNNP